MITSVRILRSGLVFALAVIVAVPARAQRFSRPLPGLQTVAEDRSLAITSSAVNGNPAWLSLEPAASDLWVHLNGRSTTGALRGAFDPASPEVYQYFVEGSKSLADGRVFRGEFGFQQDLRSGWRWIDTKEYATSNPFVLGDSSSGETAYRGIVTRAQYGMILDDTWLLGAEVSYGVNNGVKQVTPKPTSTNRDIAGTVGVGYLFPSGLAVGAAFRYLDRQEEVSFADEGSAVLTETILFKIRGLDRLLRLTKKNEMRNTQLRGYEGTGTLSTAADAATVVSAFGSGGVRTSTVTDGGTSPVEQGYWQSTDAAGHLRVHHRMGRMMVGLRADYAHEEYWSRHPEFNVRMLRGTASLIGAGAGVEAEVLPGSLTVAGEYTVAREKQDVDDHLSAISIDQARMVHTLGALARWTWSERLQTTVAYTVSLRSPVRSVIDAPVAGWYFQTVRRIDFDLFAARTTLHTARFACSYDTGLFGDVTLLLEYAREAVRGESGGATSSRSVLQAGASVRVLTF
jgi:hypothetical protein